MKGEVGSTRWGGLGSNDTCWYCGRALVPGSSKLHFFVSYFSEKLHFLYNTKNEIKCDFILTYVTYLTFFNVII